MRLHKIRVEKISSFHRNKYAVRMTFDYYLLCFNFNQFDLFTKVYTITAYCIHQTLDIHNFRA